MPRCLLMAVILGLAVAGLHARAGQPESPMGIVAFVNPDQPPSYRPLDPTQAARVTTGQSVFNTQWVARGLVGGEREPVRQGLGPLYNATACATCHPGGRRGLGPMGDGPAPAALEIQLQVPGATPSGDRFYGHVLNTSALHGVAPEGAVSIRYSEIDGYYYPDGIRWHMREPHYELARLRFGPLAPTTIIKPRLAPALFGVGLLEAVPKVALGDRAVPAGRFGWQEEAASIRDQTTRAFAQEMGITSSDRPADDCTPEEADCLLQARSDGSPEVAEELLAALLAFEQELAVPASAAHPDNASLGSALFISIGCADCHRPRLPVELSADNGMRVSGVIAPYTDLQLHDLGIGMADQTASGVKVPSKWRTAPLWGFGYRIRTESQPTFLHDGRARSDEEAVLWHAGEAARARQEFTRLGPRSRAALLHWLETL